MTLNIYIFNLLSLQLYITKVYFCEISHLLFFINYLLVVVCVHLIILSNYFFKENFTVNKNKILIYFYLLTA